MRTLALDMPAAHWLHIRQALSLALATDRAVAVRSGDAFTGPKSEYRPLIDDIARLAAAIGAGRIAIEGDTIVFEPRTLPPGRYRIDTGPLSSAMEPLLLLMPALFHRDFRSVLECAGVTHGPLSCPTSFVKETLLSFLERLGFMGSLALKRFGFYGSGGGSAEARIYPREARRAAVPRGAAAVTGARVVFSRTARELAERERCMMADALGIGEDRVSILEVIDADGIGNSLQAFLAIEGLPVVIFRELRVVDASGAIIMGEDDLAGAIAGIAREAREASSGTLPDRLASELIPYCMMAGEEPPPARGPLAAETSALCTRLL